MNGSPTQRTTIATLALLGLGALMTGIALVQAAGFPVLITGFSLLALGPYVIFCCACVLARGSGGRAVATFAICAIATAFAIFFYADLIFINPGSMNGLVFYFVPVFQLCAAVPLVIVLLIMALVSRSRRRVHAGSQLAREQTNPAE